MRSKKDTNFEINLLPVISVLAVCICFLLLTAVWTHVGTMDVSQALGEKSTQSDDKAQEDIISIWVKLQGSGDVDVTLHFEKKLEKELDRIKETRISSRSGEVDWDLLKATIFDLSQKIEKKKNVIILPDLQSKYEDIMKVMDEFRQVDINEIGVAPI